MGRKKIHRIIYILAYAGEKKSNIILGGNHNRRKIKKFKKFLKIREVKNVFIFHTVDLQGREEK